MRKIGLLGGMAWPSTVDYYRALCLGANARFAAAGHGMPLPTPPIVIDSVDISRTRALRGIDGDEASWAAYDAMLLGVFDRLIGAGAEIVAMASNTPHARLSAIQDRIQAPVISILDETATAAATHGATRALVLGTSVTMQGGHYPAALHARGIEANTRLPDTEIEAMQRLIDTAFHSATPTGGRAALLETCARHGAGEAGMVVILGCTELPLAFPDHLDDPVFEAEGFTFINPSAAHVRGILRACFRGEVA